MIGSHVDELVAVIGELRVLFPEWRLGQLIGNLAMAAGLAEIGDIWNVEDEQLLAAAQRLIQRNKGREKPTAAVREKLVHPSSSSDISR